MVSFLPGRLLLKIDRATMLVSLEGHPRLLDHTVVRFSRRLPRGMRESGSFSNRLCCAGLQRYMLEGLLLRLKQGFEPPLGNWIRGSLWVRAENLLFQKSLAETPYFVPVPVQAIRKEHKANARDWRFEFWNVLIFQAWRKARRV